MSKQYVLNADGTQTEIKAVPFMTVEEARVLRQSMSEEDYLKTANEMAAAAAKKAE